MRSSARTVKRLLSGTSWALMEAIYFVNEATSAAKSPTL